MITSIPSLQKILEKYERKRIKADNDQQLDQYFVLKGILHYIDVGAAKVCERRTLPIQHLDGEEEFILTQAQRGGSYNALQMEKILDELGINSNNGTEEKKTIEAPQSFVHAFFKWVWPLNTWKKKVVLGIVIFVVACFLFWTSILPDEIKTRIISREMDRITNHPKPPPKPDVKGESPTSGLQPEVSKKPEIKKTIPQQRLKGSDSRVPKSATPEKTEEGTGVKIYPDENFNK